MLRIYGHSDDVVVIEGDFKDETTSGRVITIGDDKMGVRVVFKYSAGKNSGAVWRGSVEQLDEGVPMFPITVSEAEPNGYPDPRSYSVMYTIDCPPGTRVRFGKSTTARTK